MHIEASGGRVDPATERWSWPPPRRRVRGNHRARGLLDAAAMPITLRSAWPFVGSIAACSTATGDADDTGTSAGSTAATSSVTDAPPASTDGSGASDDAGPGTTAGPPADTGDDTGPVGSADFDTRCAAPGVVRCVGFDATSDITGTFGDIHGILPGQTTPELDTGVVASGASSLKFTIPTMSPADTSGSYFTNFSDDLSVQFDGDADFFVQWRQRFSPEFIATHYDEGNGWKQAIIGVGDQPGCDASHAISIDGGGHCAPSCTELETVVQNTGQRQFAQMYDSCTGSASHGAYDPFEEPFGDFDFELQNARPAPYCLYSQDADGSHFPPAGSCFGYVADEWMTFQVEIQTGPRQGDEFVGSHVRMWIAREGQPSELVLDWGPYNLTAGDPAKLLRYGKVWLLPYHTNKSAAQDHATAYTWYDELIVSTERIADPP